MPEYRLIEWPKYRLIEWTKLPRSIRYSANGLTADVWPMIVDRERVYKFTVIDADGCYTDCGTAKTQGTACERALEAMGL